MKKKIRFALIGCGRISKNHFEAINKNDGAELVAVCDIIEERAKEAGLEQGVPYYSDYKKMLNRNDIDIVSICTPSGLHPMHGIMAANKGYHVLCEKPIATNISQADEFIEVCKKKQVKLFVVLQNRLNTTLQLVKNAVDNDLFGQVYMVSVNVFWTRKQDYYNLAEWRGTLALDGGAFLNQAIHYVDMLLWLFGDVQKVHSITGTLARDIEMEDTGSAVILFRSGIIGSINVTMLTYPKNYEGSLTILGEKGTVKVGGIAVNKIIDWNFEDNKGIAPSTIVDYVPPNVYGYGHIGYYRNAIEVLLNDREPDVDGEEGRKSLALIMDVYNQNKA